MKNLNLIHSYFSCYETGDKVTLEALLDDQFEFSSPHDNKLDKATYFERCWDFNKRVEKYQLLRIIENNNEAFVSYKALTYDKKEVDNVEYFEINNGKIIKIEVYYGNLSE